MDFYKFRHPFTCMVTGPTMSGKTILVRRILQHFNQLISINTNKLKILWTYGQWQELFNQNIINVSVQYLPGLPSLEDLKDINLVVIDDLMNEIGDNKSFADLFTKGAHHLNLSVIYISQNLFHQGKVMRTIGLNCHYIIIMKSIRGKSQISILCRDTFPGKSKAILEAYDDATTSSPYSYLRLDFTQQTPDKYRVVSRLTPEENNNILSPIVYIIR